MLARKNLKDRIHWISNLHNASSYLLLHSFQSNTFGDPNAQIFIFKRNKK